MAEQQILDLGFLYDLAENDTKYIYEVVSLYIKNVTESLGVLEELVNGDGDYEDIKRRAHALKSSAGIVKVREMYDDLVALEHAARDQKERKELKPVLDNILKNFNAALPLLKAEQARTQP